MLTTKRAFGGAGAGVGWLLAGLAGVLPAVPLPLGVALLALLVALPVPAAPLLAVLLPLVPLGMTNVMPALIMSGLLKPLARAIAAALTPTSAATWERVCPGLTV